MPPRICRELPARRDARIRKHLAQAKDYWLKDPLELTQGDVCQAGEKGWGTVAQLTKAVATHRGWQHYDHVATQEAITAISDEMPDRVIDIGRGLGAAERMRGNFYEGFMTPTLAELALSEVGPLLEILWGLLLEEYTDGGSFAEWAASDDS